MENTYEEIVRKWYLQLRPNFTTLLLERYKNSNLTLADVENIYQDIFIAIHKNLKDNRIKPDTNWDSYILRIGLNMASKRQRKLGKHDSLEKKEENNFNPDSKTKRISDLLASLPSDDDDPDIHSNAEAQALLGDQLTHTPEPCASIIRLTYYGYMSDKEIAQLIPEYRDNGKDASVNAKAVRARRWLCMRDLVYRVKLALFNAGIIDVKPIKIKRNGKQG
ncbi:MAG: hypothetical protein K2G90_07160 [Muribaculaceae bacterium]|nr:hypothetical protein [Muribaculaceae bacterium]